MDYWIPHLLDSIGALWLFTPTFQSPFHAPPFGVSTVEWLILLTNHLPMTLAQQLAEILRDDSSVFTNGHIPIPTQKAGTCFHWGDGLKSGYQLYTWLHGLDVGIMRLYICQGVLRFTLLWDSMIYKCKYWNDRLNRNQIWQWCKRMDLPN